MLSGIFHYKIQPESIRNLLHFSEEKTAIFYYLRQSIYYKELNSLLLGSNFGKMKDSHLDELSRSMDARRLSLNLKYLGNLKLMKVCGDATRQWNRCG